MRMGGIEKTSWDFASACAPRKGSSAECCAIKGSHGAVAWAMSRLPVVAEAADCGFGHATNCQEISHLHANQDTCFQNLNQRFGSDLAQICSAVVQKLCCGTISFGAAHRSQYSQHWYTRAPCMHVAMPGALCCALRLIMRYMMAVKRTFRHRHGGAPNYLHHHTHWCGLWGGFKLRQCAWQ